MDEINILHIISSLDGGGAEKLISELLPLINNNQDNINIELLLLSRNNNKFIENLEGSNIEIHYSPYSNPRSFKNIIYFRKILKNKFYDAVHMHLFPEFYYLALATIFLNRNPFLFLTEHSTSNRRRNIRMARPIEKYIYSKYDFIVAISNDTKEELLCWIGKTEENVKKINTIPNGINLDKFEMENKHLKKHLISSYKENDILLCMVGRFTEEKDQITIIKALSLLPDNIKLVLVGVGPREIELRSIVNNNNLQKRVSFLGFRYDISAIYQSCDIGIISSNWEGFGLSAVESMASGLPTLASNIPGLSGVVCEPNLLFEKNNHYDLAKKIKDLLVSEENYKKMSDYCFKRAKMFSIEKTSNEYAFLYEKKIRRM